MNKTFILASNNKKKLAELKTIFGTEYDVLTLSEAGISSDPEETGKTFEENSFIKARSAVDASGTPCIADDSGLCVEALDGAPGVFSSRFSEMHGIIGDNQDEENNKLLVNMLKGSDNRKAAFVSYVTLLFPDGRKITAEGRVEGIILDLPRGRNGFGYDPLFYVPELGKTTAELSPEEKNAISHRGKALRLLCEKLKGEKYDND